MPCRPVWQRSRRSRNRDEQVLLTHERASCVRVMTLAKELRVSNADLLRTLAEMGLCGCDFMSLLTQEEVTKVKNVYGVRI